ncbi:MAG: hypothetical protein HQL86_02300 [Magnetococcales bacterium]|nr:hypothetical protein [Magnetococcales bacterium]
MKLVAMAWNICYGSGFPPETPLRLDFLRMGSMGIIPRSSTDLKGALFKPSLIQRDRAVQNGCSQIGQNCVNLAQLGMCRFCW